MSAAPMSFIPKPPANKTHGPCTVHPGVAMVQKWIEELPGKTGRSLEEWIALTKTSGPPTEKERREWLKKEQWRGPSMYDDVMNENAVPPPPPTHVTVSFATNGEQTTVRVSHTGWLEGERWAEARAWHVHAWKAVFQNLAAFVEPGRLPVDWSAPAVQG